MFRAPAIPADLPPTPHTPSWEALLCQAQGPFIWEENRFPSCQGTAPGVPRRRERSIFFFFFTEEKCSDSMVQMVQEGGLLEIPGSSPTHHPRSVCFPWLFSK